MLRSTLTAMDKNTANFINRCGVLGWIYLKLLLKPNSDLQHIPAARVYLARLRKQGLVVTQSYKRKRVVFVNPEPLFGYSNILSVEEHSHSERHAHFVWWIVVRRYWREILANQKLPKQAANPVQVFRKAIAAECLHSVKQSIPKAIENRFDELIGGELVGYRNFGALDKKLRRLSKTPHRMWLRLLMGRIADSRATKLENEYNERLEHIVTNIVQNLRNISLNGNLPHTQ
jgi:hypothetical protein